MSGEGPDGLIDDERFHTDLPVWVLFLANRADMFGNFPTDAAVISFSLDAPGRPVYLPVFTDWDLALRFIMKHEPLACGIPLGVERLLDLLVRHQAAGLQLVSFDPGDVRGGTLVRTTPIADVIAGIRGES